MKPFTLIVSLLLFVNMLKPTLAVSLSGKQTLIQDKTEVKVQKPKPICKDTNGSRYPCPK
jgi:hypothetical protein